MIPVCDAWRAGFEIELLLGDLFDERFEDYLDDPMDEASHDYCRAVAAQLSDATGRRWTAPLKKQTRTGYYVYPEYNLDPIEWEWGIVAGVELVTPPLPLAEAEELRRDICAWVIEVDGEINTYPNAISQTAGWHINVDSGGQGRLDPADMALCVEETGILLYAKRYPSRYAAPQRHAFGAPFLRQLRSDFPINQFADNIGNFLRSHAGRSKRYATNLGKLESGYIELRHYGTERFFSKEPLARLIAPFVRAAQANHESKHRLEKRLLATFEVLDDWLRAIEPRLQCSWKPESEYVNISFGVITFDGKPLGGAKWDGDAEFTLMGSAEDDSPTIREQHGADFAVSIAVLALDVAIIRGAIHGAMPLENAAFSRAIDQLGATLASRGLLDEPEIVPFDTWRAK
jgi:hypothetical protein